MTRSNSHCMASSPMILAILLGSLVAAGCQPPTQQGVAQQFAALLKSVADRLDQVQSKEDADRAAADIQRLIAAGDDIVTQARQAEASGKVDAATQQSVKQQLERIRAAGERLRARSLLTDSLTAAMQQVGYSSESIVAAAKSGKLPPPATPLEEAWVAVIQVQEKHADRVGALTTPAAVEKAVGDLIAFRRQLHAALTKVAELGGAEPPHGVPDKYRKHYDAAAARLTEKDAAVTAMLGQETLKRLAEQIDQALAGDAALAKDPFELSGGIRAAGTKATITLVNNKSLAGERHQQMIARLKELAGAAEAQSVIEPDGTYKLVLAPVADFGRLIAGIDFGDISERNDQARSFTLTIDPARFAAAAPAEAPGGSGGFPFRPGPGGANPLAAAMELEKAQFMARVGGKHKCITVTLLNAPPSDSPQYDALLEALRRVSGATSTASFSVNRERQVLLGPVDDVEAVAAKIDFGTVTAKDPGFRRITLAVDITKFRPK